MIDSLGWQRVFAQLPEITVVEFDIGAVCAHSRVIALTLAVDGWCRPVHRLGARLAHAAATSATEAEIAADLRRQLADIAESW